MSEPIPLENPLFATHPEIWARIEIMGHQLIAGRVSTDTIFGTSLIRVEIPIGEEFVTQLLNAENAIFRISFIPESLAREIAFKNPPSILTDDIVRKHYAAMEADRAIHDRSDPGHDDGSNYL